MKTRLAILLLFAVAGIAGVCMAGGVVKGGKGAASFGFAAVQGIAALFAVNLTGMITGVTIAVNWYTLLTYIILGLPGVIATLVLNFIMAV